VSPYEVTKTYETTLRWDNLFLSVVAMAPPSTHEHAAHQGQDERVAGSQKRNASRARRGQNVAIKLIWGHLNFKMAFPQNDQIAL